MPCVGSAWGRAARRLQGWACGRAWFGSGAGGGQTRIGTRACQTRIGKWPGQIRIGNTGGSNPKRERAAPKKEKTTRGCWFLPAAFYWGFNQGFYWAAKNLGFYPGFYLGLAASGFYLGKNLGRSPGVVYSLHPLPALHRRTPCPVLSSALRVARTFNPSPTLVCIVLSNALCVVHSLHAMPCTSTLLMLLDAL